MDLQLKGDVVLVTGSSSGIGRATAIMFGAEGARVAVTYHRNKSGAEDTARAVREAGSEALVMPYDLGSPDAIRACLEQVERQWGVLHALVNNAAPMDTASPSRGNFEDVPLEHWETMLRPTLEGVVLTIQCSLPLMRKSGRGRMVHVSSDAVDGWPGLGPYATAKAGLDGLNRTLAVELGPAGILSNIVMPGAVMTERTARNLKPEHREQIKARAATRQLTTPEDVAAVIVFLASQRNRQVTGEVIRVTGGR
jgi:NAD(P)-dependent dehydrogenase (short-subunit alcohol dehydrogenase family)